METKEQPIVLVLTREQAKTLADLTATVAGNDKTTYRRDTESVQNQLAELGIDFAAYSSNRFKSDSCVWAKEIYRRSNDNG